MAQAQPVADFCLESGVRFEPAAVNESARIACAHRRSDALATFPHTGATLSESPRPELCGESRSATLAPRSS